MPQRRLPVRPPTPPLTAHRPRIALTTTDRGNHAYSGARTIAKRYTLLYVLNIAP